MYNPLKPQTAVPDDDEDEGETDVPVEIQVRFWKLVALLNVAILVLALGLMFLAFRGRLLLGGGAALVGALLLAYCGVDYRRSKARIAEINAERADDAERGDEANRTDDAEQGSDAERTDDAARGDE